MTKDDHELTPCIAVLGAGPIGLEAALYGRYLGFQVAVFEKETVAHSVRRWGHVRMFSPFEMNRSPLGIAALKAQDKNANLPDADALLTGAEYAERYLIPLAQSDLLANCVHEHVEVLKVGRDGVIKSDVDDLDRSDYRFRVLLREGQTEEIAEADFVLDTTGVYDQPKHAGHGGIPALGEAILAPEFDRHVPDILGEARARFANRHSLVIGGGYSAATSVAALSELRREAPETQVTWITRRAMNAADGPITRRINDRLQHRDRLAERVNALALSDGNGIRHFGQTSVLAIAKTADGFLVSTGGKLQGDHQFNAIIANVGYRPNTSLYEELQVEACYATEAPRKISDRLLAAGHVDCLDLESMGAQVLTHPEPGFFILGSKSFGRNSNFLLAKGIEQIRDVYTIIGDREDLDLYKTMEHLAG